VTNVLVVGAGPTGLTLACDLARRGVDVRIIDRNDAFPNGSRGKGLSPRSLEVLDDLGVIDETLAGGVTHLPHRKYQGAQIVSEVDPEAGHEPTDQIPYPVGLMIPQWRVEQILRGRLAGYGVKVELGTELTALEQDADGVTATIAGGTTITAGHLVGCDGGRSTVRKLLGLKLRGETPDVQLMAVGDVEVDGLSRDAWHQWFTGAGGIMLCPLPGIHAFQVQAAHELDGDGEPLEPTLERFQQTFDRFAGVPGVRLHDLTWRSTYRVQVRMVDRLRIGRVFLAGDAAHVHPIAGGLGMNTGIQDAYNLGWKLGWAINRRAAPGLLETYEDERLPIASWLLSITSEVLVAVLDAIKRRGGGLDAGAARELSQLTLKYPWSRLSRQETARPDRPQAGDRMPDARLADGTTVFSQLRGPHFTLFGPPSISSPPSVSGPPGISGSLGLSELVKTCAVGDADALTLVRPDGYIGLIADPSDPDAVRRYLTDL
jgi:2-polyprenyl-6-methoxyphenol hydroxylase-like FAD-dependent oxidoreductase